MSSFQVSLFYFIIINNSAFIYIAREKSHKHSNEELFNQKFHKQNGNIFRFQPKI
jgi:hypothetical protein